MTKFASATSVSPERSRAEIESTLRRYKAENFCYGWNGSTAMIGFTCFARQVRFLLPLPDRKAKAITHAVRRGQLCVRSESQQEEAYEQFCRQRWRALLLVIKAKLEAVESGICTFEQEFLGHIVLPGGMTCSEWLLPQIEIAYRTGTMPPLLEFKKE